ncbi:YhbY family RNA-binding protein [Nanoarchaeota archaeon]
MVVTNVQLGKGGITDNFIETIKNGFKKHDQVKVQVLQSFSRDKADIKKSAQEICDKIENKRFKFKPKLIGFTITLLRFKNKK